MQAERVDAVDNRQVRLDAVEVDVVLVSGDPCRADPRIAILALDSAQWSLSAEASRGPKPWSWFVPVGGSQVFRTSLDSFQSRWQVG